MLRLRCSRTLAASLSYSSLGSQLPYRRQLASQNTKKPGPAHENIYTIPNVLTVSRILMTPGISYLFIQARHKEALALLAFAGMTDLVDGHLARKYNMGTVVGSIIDPLADKLLMTTLVSTLAYAGNMPLLMAVIILGRDFALGISALYWRWISLPPPRTFTRFWDFSLPSASVHPTSVSKINTGLQLVLVGAYMVQPVLPFDIALPLSLYEYLVASTTIYSGLEYTWRKDTVKILKQ
ncbi:CDP-alcohol phosphatidyltransferase-domain-containing protein [Protomyces lactucae-debilis]|uniref:CDP-alcohol phosphatidyltransferase-domain-containing protein n=1 Tax=Protomyces lactucae-debilis TaxID=2754530 RepID=A0A1Y2F346_PROLT|nr:CDP-alcohol phosphatidyltransferase-domain-containing protein [Protomyces lactucae-debilis]ORY78107.1 CDP-alcohol phosphatidyltransferase-domain-containing protein [Protomyces lactucae-debilis]